MERVLFILVVVFIGAGVAIGHGVWGDDCNLCPSQQGSIYGNITNNGSFAIDIPIPTPAPIFAFPYEFCANGCLICTDHLGNCTYIHGKPTPTPG